MTKKKLNEISRLLNGYAFKSSKYVQSGLRVIRIANVQDGYLSDSDPCFYPIETTNELEQFLLKPHDLLMSLTGNVGRVAFIEKEYLPAGLNQRVECIRPFNESDKEYLYYFFRSPIFQRESLKASHGSAQLNLSTVWLANFYVVYPDEEKRKTAVNTLRTIDNLIREKRNQLIELDSLIKSRFMERFTNVDKRKLSEIAEIIMGQSPDSKSYNESGNGLPFFQGKGDFGEKYTKIGHWTTSPTKTAKLNDVLMSVRAPVGPVNIASTDCCIGRGLCAIRAENGLTNSEFLYNALKVMEPEIALMGNGSTFKAINKKDVYSLLIPVASAQNQESFSKFASLIDKSRFVVHSRYFLWLNFTFVSSTIAYSRVVSILECPKRC